MPVQHINSDGAFDRAMKEASTRSVCVDFFAEWCGPCKMIAPVFEQLSAKFPTVVFLKVDVDQCPGASARNGVAAMPTFMMFVNGIKKDMVRGADAGALESMVRKHAYSSGGGQTVGGRTVGGGSSTGGSSFAAGDAAPPAGEPGLWQAANDRLRTTGIPSFTVSGFVIEPAALVLAVIGLLFYGPLGAVIVIGLACLSQTSASPFDRYQPTGADAGAARPSGGNNPAPRPAPPTFSGSGRRLGD